MYLFSESYNDSYQSRLLKLYQNDITELNKNLITASLSLINTENLTRKVEKLADIVETSQQHSEQLISLVLKDYGNTINFITVC